MDGCMAALMLPAAVGSKSLTRIPRWIWILYCGQRRGAPEFSADAGSFNPADRWCRVFEFVIHPAVLAPIFRLLLLATRAKKNWHLDIHWFHDAIRHAGFDCAAMFRNDRTSITLIGEQRAAVWDGRTWRNRTLLFATPRRLASIGPGRHLAGRKSQSEPAAGSDDAAMQVDERASHGQLVACADAVLGHFLTVWLLVELSLPQTWLRSSRISRACTHLYYARPWMISSTPIVTMSLLPRDRGRRWPEAGWGGDLQSSWCTSNLLTSPSP